jgi:hypothetical protein
VVAALMVGMLAGCGGGRSELSQASPPDAVYVNGRFLTVDEAFTTAEAVALSDGRFVAVGTDAEVRALAADTTRIVDLGGRTVVPGFGDSHIHDAGGGPGVDLAGTRTIDDVLAAVAARVEITDPGDVVVSNSDWHESQLVEDRLPLRRDLDTVAPETPVVLVRGGHEYVLNSAALARWAITTATPVPAGGEVSRYDDGELNGELVDTAKALATLPPPAGRTREEQIDDLLAEHAALNAAGLTSIRYGAIGPPQYRLLEEMRQRGVLTIRVSALLGGPRGPQATAESVGSTIEAFGVGPDDGDEWLRPAGIKLMVDGGYEGGLMREPYAEPYGKGGTFRGLQVTPRDSYVEIVKEINRLGWRPGTHAVGDDAVEQVIAAYEAAHAETSIVGRRWVLEHGFLPSPDHFERMNALGIALTAQHHPYVAGPAMTRYWGAERAARVPPVREYLDGGVIAASGSDSGVVPFPPLQTFAYFVSRATMHGSILGAEHKVTREEALRMATWNNAYLTFEEEIKGSIEPGKLADFVVLSDDLLTVPDDQLDEIAVLMTVVGGEVVFTDASLEAAAPVDLLLVNGNVVTVDSEFSVAQAVAISDGRFVRVGRNPEVRALAGPDTRVVDLEGRTVVPGFIDTHSHTFRRGERGLRSPSLVGLGSVRAIVEAIGAEAARTPTGEWIVTTPIGEPPDYFHLPGSLEEQRWPTRADLDAAAPENPVYIPIGIWPYPVIFNSEALSRLGITASGPEDDRHVRIHRDPSTGEPTGLIEGMIFYLPSPLWGALQRMLPRPTPEQQRDAVRTALRENTAAGVTTIFESHGAQPEFLEHYRALRASGDLPGRMVMSYSVNSADSVDAIDRWMGRLADASGRGSGDDVIRTLGVTVAFDGATQFGAAYMYEPYLDIYGEPTTGSTPMDQAKLSAIAELAARHDLRLQFTFAGDAAAEMILTAIESANAQTSIVDRRWLMQHFQHPTPDHVRRTERLGLHVTGYTAVDYSKGAAVYVDRFESDLWKNVIPTRWWFDAGVNLAQSTDGAHYEALFTLWESLVRIDGRTGQSLMSPAKRISREEALRMYTINGARVVFMEDRLGSIEPGKLADLVVLDRDIMTVPVDEIRDAQVMLTMVGGEIVYEAAP